MDIDNYNLRENFTNLKDKNTKDELKPNNTNYSIKTQDLFVTYYYDAVIDYIHTNSPKSIRSECIDIGHKYFMDYLFKIDEKTNSYKIKKLYETEIFNNPNIRFRDFLISRIEKYINSEVFSKYKNKDFSLDNENAMSKRQADIAVEDTNLYNLLTEDYSEKLNIAQKFIIKLIYSFMKRTIVNLLAIYEKSSGKARIHYYPMLHFCYSVLNEFDDKAIKNNISELNSKYKINLTEANAYKNKERAEEYLLDELKKFISSIKTIDEEYKKILADELSQIDIQKIKLIVKYYFNRQKI